ncbi:MAG: response regulator [Chloroflexi bacterium]|nr:response regulator [Chloroflexota bacterium]
MFYRLLPIAAFLMEAILIWALLRVWKRRALYPVLLLYLISIAIWAFFIGGLRYSSSLETALIWEKLVFPLIPLMSLLLFHFCFLFTGETGTRKPLTAVYVLNLSAFALSFTPLVLQGVQLRPYGYAPVVGPLGSVWFASVYVPPLWGMLLLWRFYRSSHLPEDRNRALYLLAGLAFLLAGGVTDWLAALGRFPHPLGMVGHIILSALITVAVIRYHLFDIRPHFYSVAAYFLAGGAVIVAYGAIWSMSSYLLQGSALLIVVPLGLALYPATRWLHRTLAAWFNRRKFESRKLLEDLPREAAKILDLDELASSLTRAVAAVMTAYPVHLYLYNAERKVLEPINSTGGNHHRFPSFPENGLFASRLKAIDHALTARDLLVDPVLRVMPDHERQSVITLGGQVFVPLKSRQRLVGMMVLGEKASWETYNRQEIDLLAKTTQHVAMVLDNARLYSDALRARNNLETWLNSMSDSVIIVSPEHEVQFMNRNAITRFGSNMGRPCWEVLGRNTRCPVCLAQPTLPGMPQSEQQPVSIKDRLYDASAAPLVNPDGTTSVIEVLRDITEREQAAQERRELERKAQVASRLATVGEMASGIAHEINNPLTGVIGFSDLLLKEDLPGDIKKNVKIINDGAERVAAIVKRLLAFARQQKPERKLVDINEVLDTTLQLRSYELKTSNIVVTTALDPDLPKTMADGGQLQQVFLNLIINAEKEMKLYRGNGSLHIATEKSGDNINVSFKDDGPGIARENLEKIFTPFFTTRKVGEGTGLGLSVCWGIVAEHKGRIYVQSEQGQGATFFVEIPIVPQRSFIESGEHPASYPAAHVRGKVLVVDDDPDVTHLLNEVLTGDGHDVYTVDNADEALDTISRDAHDLILLDIKLPGTSGIQLYRHLQEQSPQLVDKVVFITGDVMAVDTRDFLSRTGAPHLTKPFNVREFRAYVRGFLARNAGL